MHNTNMSRCSTVIVFWVASSALVFLSSLCGVEGKNSMRCSNSTKPSTTLRPSADGVKARYVMEWCTDANPNDTQWEFQIAYDRYNRKPRYNTKFLHSAKVETLNWTQPLQCDNVCLSTSLDLMFNSSYTIRNWFPGRGSLADITNHQIINEYTRDDFSPLSVKGTDINHGDYVSVHFFLENIPAADYFTQLCKKSPEHEVYADCVHIDANCSTPYSAYEVVCRLRLPIGRYRVTLNFYAPWVRSDFLRKNVYERDITVARVGTAQASGAGGAWGAWVRWAACAAGALCGGALLLLLALRCRRAMLFRKEVLKDWLHRGESKAAAAPAAAAGPVLLLYARECAAAAPVIDALRALLETVAPGQVYDICSPETVALAACGGGEWVRGVMARPDSRVVLLQTPALQALHTPRLVNDNGTPRLEQPLLSGRAAYRAPAPADWLLQFALRLLAAAVPRAGDPPPYKKYYLATLEGLETEALPYTVPFRRYVVPRHALDLARDLGGPGGAGGAVPPHALDSLARAALDFVDFARAHPHYLADELLVL